MERELQARALALFQEAIAQPDGTREHWLGLQCGDDAQLLATVRRLLAADAANTDRLRTGGALSATSEPMPEQLGPYRIVDTLGAGGMGIVYRGERDDGAFERTVAIKLIGAGASAFSDEAQRRFANERQILARMNHPNVAQLLDGGTDQGRTFLVMEYIDGALLVHDTERPRNSTVALFAKVCDAVAFAHDNLVLHRDIKPGNVLVDKSGEPKLLDFGVAKLNQAIAGVGTLDLTGAAQAPMTLTYSAPERLHGDAATISTDVYSLGVYLFELLSGERAFDLSGLTLAQAHREVIEADLAGRYDGPKDLAQIIASATHSDPTRRYASAAALAADLRAFLARKPISARSDDWRYLIGRFVSRYREGVIAASLALAALVASLIATSQAYLEADHQSQIAQRERDTAQDTVDFLTSLLAEANPWESGEQELTVKDILGIASEQVPSISSPVARAYVESALSRVHDGRGEYAQALTYAQAAIDKLEGTGVSDARKALAFAWYGLVLHNNDQNAQARDALREALSLTADLPARGGSTALAAYATLGAVYEDLNQEEQAEALYHEAIDFYETTALDDGPQFAQVLNNLGRLHHKRSELETAAELYGEALSHLTERPVQRAIGLANLAGVYGELERTQAAQEMYRESLTAFEASVGLAHPQAIITGTGFAHFLVNDDRVPEAETQIALTLAQAATALAPDHFITAYVQNIAGITYCTGSKPQLGLTMAERSLATRRQILPEGHWTIASGESVLGLCAGRTGDYERAESLLTSAIQQLSELRGAEDRATVLAKARLADVRAASEGR
ncbi:MAG: serine/threonine-protein kinase [Pseudomonadota bacterium]